MFFLLLSGCVSKPVITGPSESYLPDPEERLFSQAGLLFDKDDSEGALKLYVDYAIQYPLGRYADTAFFRMAEIYRRIGELYESEAFFRKVIDDFPQSPLVGKAHLAIVDLMIGRQRYDEAISKAAGLIETGADADMRRQLSDRIVAMYQQSGNRAAAAINEFILYATAPASEKDQWGRRLEQTISQLGAEDIESVWDSLSDEKIRGFLMCRFAVLQAISENYDDAFEILMAFLKVYPDHAHAAQAAGLADTLARKLIFQPLTVGCLLPLSGPYKMYGMRALNGIELALSLQNKGESALPIRLLIKDTMSDESSAVRAVGELAESGAGLILGPIAAAPAAAREAQKRQIPIITFTQKLDITSIGDYVFRHFITPTTQVQTLVGYFVNTVGLRDFAILYPNETYGETFMELFWDEVIRQGGRVVGVETYEKTHTDFAGTIKKLVGSFHKIPKELQAQPVVRIKEDPYFRDYAQSAGRLGEILPDPVSRLSGLFFQRPDQDRVRGPAVGRVRQQKTDDPIVDFDVLFIPDAPKKAGLIIPQLAYYDVNDIYLAGTNLWHSEQLIEMSKDYVRNAVMVDGFFKDSPSGTVNRFVDTYQQIYGRDPDLLDAFAFDTAVLVFDLLSQPAITMRHQLRDALKESYKADGVTGPMAFDPQGEAIKRLSLLRVQNGRFVDIPNP